MAIILHTGALATPTATDLLGIIKAQHKASNPALPFDLTEVDALIAEKKHYLKKHYDINITDKTKSRDKARDFVLGFCFGIDDGVQAIKGAVAQIAQDAIKALEFAKTLDEELIVHCDTSEGTPFILKDSTNDIHIQKRGWSDDSLFWNEDAWLDRTEDDFDLEIFRARQSALKYAYMALQVAVSSGEMECGGGLGLGCYTEDLDYLASDFDISYLQSGDSLHDENYWAISDQQDILLCLMRRPSNDDIDAIIKQFRTLTK